MPRPGSTASSRSVCVTEGNTLRVHTRCYGQHHNRQSVLQKRHKSKLIADRQRVASRLATYRRVWNKRCIGRQLEYPCDFERLNRLRYVTGRPVLLQRNT